MTDEEKIKKNKQIKDKMETDNKKMLEDLIELIEEKIRKIDLSDDYLKEHNLATREEVGIGEYSYGISMIPCESVYPFLLDLQIKNKTIKTQQEEIEKWKRKYDNLKSYNKGTKEALRVSEDLERHFSEEASKLEAEIEKKDAVINEIKKYAEQVEKFTEYEKKNSKLGRNIELVKEGLTINYKMNRVANDILSIINKVEKENKDE